MARGFPLHSGGICHCDGEGAARLLSKLTEADGIEVATLWPENLPWVTAHADDARPGCGAEPRSGRSPEADLVTGPGGSGGFARGRERDLVAEPLQRA